MSLTITTKSALEKLKSIPIGKRIRISSCDTLEVQYVIWRTDEDEYRIEVKTELDIDALREMILEEKQLQEGKDETEFQPTPEGFEPICYYYQVKEGLTAQQILELKGFLTNVDNLQLAHDIELHELYEIPTHTEEALMKETMKGSQ